MNLVSRRDAAMQDRRVHESVMLVGHGTRDEEGTRQFFALSDRLAELIAPAPVAPALLEFQSPTIEEAWGQLVASGATHISVAPLLLFSAGHAKQDIPGIVAHCQLRTPHVTWSQSRPLSRHPAVIDLSVERGRAAVSICTSPRSGRALVFVGRGSHDPCAQADTRLLGHLVGHRLQVAATFTAFYAMAEPSVPAVLDLVASCGHYRDIIVQPHLLFAGRLHEAIVKQTAEAALRHPHMHFHLADYLGPQSAIAQAINDRQRASFG